MNEDERKLKWLEKNLRQYGDSVEEKRKWLQWQLENQYEDSNDTKTKQPKQTKKVNKKKKDDKLAKFKKGDRVRMISTESENARYFHGDFENLEIEKSYKGGYDYIVKNGSGASIGVNESEIELINTKPLFAVGNLVSFKDANSSNASYFRKGLKNLEIKQVHEHNNELKYIVFESDKSSSWSVHEDELMPADIKLSIKVGDLVDVNMNHPDVPNGFARWFKSGSSGLKVLDVDSHHYNLETKDDNSWWVDGEYLTLHGEPATKPSSYSVEYLEKLTRSLKTSENVGNLAVAEATELLNRHYIYLLSDSDGVLVHDDVINLTEVQYKNMKECITGKLLTKMKYYKTIDKYGASKISSCYVYDVQVSGSDIIKDASLDVESVWKNPKPTQKNQKDIEVGYLVMVDGEAPMLEVIKVTQKTCFVKKADGTEKKFMKSSCYPMFEQLDSNVVKVGNIVKIKGNEHYVIVKRINSGRIESTIDMEFHVSEVEKVYAKEKQTIEFTQFACGSVTYEGKRYKSKEIFEKEFPTFQYIANEEKHSLLNVDIAKHFNIEIEEIKPKEDTISHTLRTTLDHPLNVAKKRWALLVGPSGSGKTEAAIAYCKETNKEYVKLQGTAQLTVDDIIGYKSLTTGEYITSLLRDAVVNGKVFILDEIDACNPNTLLVLNGLKQEYFQFPDELVKIHKDFKFIGTANTLEYSEEYNARAPMDKATKARFKVIEYDMKPHDLAIRYGFEYIKDIKNIDRLTPREIEGLVLDKKIEEEIAHA